MHWLVLSGAFVVATVVSALVTPLMIALAVRLGALDRPDLRKAQASPVPYLGGVAIVVTFAGVVMVAAALDRPEGGFRQLAVALLAGVGIAVVGLVDDLRGVPVWLRLLAETAAAAAVFASGTQVRAFGPSVISAVVTVAWLVLVTNAFNLVDNMDGLSAGLAVVAAVAMFAVAQANGQLLVAPLCLAMAGCCLGFLRHNFHPARIYMGDGGSLFIGFLLAFLAIRLQLSHTPQVVAAFVPVFILGVILFDTVLVVVNRLGHGLSPMTPGRDHTSHRLVAIGLPVRAAVGVVYATAATLGWLAFILARLDTVTGILLIGFVLVAAAVLLVLFGTVPVYANHRERRLSVHVTVRATPDPLPSASQVERVES